MKTNLYVVRDHAMEQSWNIAEAKNDTVALREFQKLMKDREYAEDFKLMRIGSYDHDLDKGVFHDAVEVSPTVETEIEE
jgi:hypothetical protein